MTLMPSTQTGETMDCPTEELTDSAVFDAELNAIVRPHRPCSAVQAGRYCWQECSLCQWSGHDEVVRFLDVVSEDDLPF